MGVLARYTQSHEEAWANGGGVSALGLCSGWPVAHLKGVDLDHGSWERPQRCCSGGSGGEHIVLSITGPAGRIDWTAGPQVRGRWRTRVID